MLQEITAHLPGRVETGADFASRTISPRSWTGKSFASLADRLRHIVSGRQPSPDCVPRIGNENGVTVELPTPKPVAALNPAEINPGLAPDMNSSPHRQ
jgi:hypothetical protein